MNKWEKLPDKKIIERTIEELKKNGVNAFLVSTEEEAKKKVLSIIPKDAEVMNMTSVTLDISGISQDIKESGKYLSLRKKLESLDEKTQGKEMQALGTAPDWVIRSVHAVTEKGHVLIASNTGSQLPSYAYGAKNVIWVVGAQKIVKDFEEGIKRIYEHSLQLESERAKKAYGVLGSEVNKILIINKEIKSQRITLIFINKVIGF